ncbi:Cytochrome P450 [Penicillium italicum]|uniref:Cytochrome P450 n=1 Tax=Penicillium italicum TaxID=40296 RepID=A0A0A2L247_PENIT|nr:Cytochrome P450 [Penicillium italicum]
MLELHNVAIIGVVVVVIMSASCTLLHNQSREPPSVSSKIPFVGHLIGVIQYGPGYFNMLCEKHPQHSIFAVNIFSFKLFVTSSPTIMRAAQKHPTIITLEPLLKVTQKRFCQTPHEKLIRLCEKNNGSSLLSKIVHETNPALSGESLDRMNRRMLWQLLPFIDDMGNHQTIDLNAWLRHAITIVSTNITYGSLNPFQNPAIEDTFWKLERNVAILLADIVPWLISPKTWKARKHLCAAFEDYFDLAGHEDGSDLLSMRYRSFLGAGLTHKEIAYAEMPLVVGLLANTVPAAFWAHFELFSRPKLLKEIREEVEQNCLKIAPDGTHIIDLRCLRDNCPLLLSMYQEVLRTRSTMVTIRFVTQDVILADNHFLGSGTMLFMPAKQLGRDRSAWGTSADKFDGRRFMRPTTRTDDSGDKKKDPRRSGGFMAFGVSPTICPGRHLATSEILSLVAMVALRYDIAPVNGLWCAPPKMNSATISNMSPVEGTFPVTVKKRQKYEGKSWRFEITEGRGQFGLVVGRFKEGQEGLKVHNWKVFTKMLYSRMFFANGDGDYDSRRGLDNKLLGLPVEDLDTATAERIRMAENNEVPFSH